MCGSPVRCLLCPFVSRCINLKCVGPQSGVCYVPLSVGVSTWNVWAPSQVSVMSLCQPVYQLEMCGPPVRCLLWPLVSRCINLKCGGPQSGVCYVPSSVFQPEMWEASQPLNGYSGVCCALLSTTEWLIGCLLHVAVCRSVSCGLLCLIINWMNG